MLVDAAQPETLRSAHGALAIAAHSFSQMNRAGSLRTLQQDVAIVRVAEQLLQTFERAFGGTTFAQCIAEKFKRVAQPFAGDAQVMKGLRFCVFERRRLREHLTKAHRDGAAHRFFRRADIFEGDRAAFHDDSLT